MRPAIWCSCMSLGMNRMCTVRRTAVRSGSSRAWRMTKVGSSGGVAIALLPLRSDAADPTVPPFAGSDDDDDASWVRSESPPWPPRVNGWPPAPPALWWRVEDPTMGEYMGCRCCVGAE